MTDQRRGGIQPDPAVLDAEYRRGRTDGYRAGIAAVRIELANLDSSLRMRADLADEIPEAAPVAGLRPLAIEEVVESLQRDPSPAPVRRQQAKPAASAPAKKHEGKVKRMDDQYPIVWQVKR